jgi:hypothetical protein
MELLSIPKTVQFTAFSMAFAFRSFPGLAYLPSLEIRQPAFLEK